VQTKTLAGLAMGCVAKLTVAGKAPGEEALPPSEPFLGIRRY
jgi:hypothetical protein